MNDPVKPTPEPVLKAAGIYGSISALLVTAVGVLVAVGALSTAEADALTTAVTTIGENVVPVGSAIVGVTALLSGVISSVVSAFAGRRKVVPLESPNYTVTKTHEGGV